MNKKIKNKIKTNAEIVDIRTYFFKIIAHWKLIVVFLLISFAFAYYKNISTQRIYGLSTTISVKEKTNPLFSSGTSISFNWGGVSNKVETIKRTLTSRTHNEIVIKKLKFYIEYLKKGTFRMDDVYGKVPFNVLLDTTKYQIQNTLIKIELLDNDNYRLTVDFPDNKKVKLLSYDTELHRNYNSPIESYSKIHKMGEKVNLPFLNLTLNWNFDRYNNDLKEVYYIRLRSIDQVVNKYKNIRATALKGTSLVSISMLGSNKTKIVNFLNASVKEMVKNELYKKTDYARNTKAFIDKQFEITSDSLKSIESDLGTFKKTNKIYNLSEEGKMVFDQTIDLEKESTNNNNLLDYLKNLEIYIKNHATYTDIPAPAIIGLDDSKIKNNIEELTQLSVEKAYWMKYVTPDHPALKLVEAKLNTARLILIENINTLRSLINQNQLKIRKRQAEFNVKLYKMPKKQQELVNFERKFSLTESNYTYLMQKRYEASIAIAASVSDITVLDKAKDTGQVSAIPKVGFNYAIALLLGLIIPILIILLKELFNNKIQTVEQIEDNYEIPILGVIGKNLTNKNYVVFEKPKSSIAEGFRALRSNLQFMFKQDITTPELGRVVAVTSSVSGEGKTFVAINMATVFALSEKKTIIIGLDLRKPKLYKYFEMKDSDGVVNYLAGQKSVEEIIYKTKIPNLDIIPSGPIPPNPYELLLRKEMESFMTYLKKNYDYIVIDTPPIAIVSDALEIFKHADANIYVIRQNYTQKDMPRIIEQKYKMGKVSNISIVLNDFAVKNSYGYGYGYGHGYGYGYGYGNYTNGYHENEKESFIKKIKRKFKK